MKDSRKSFFYNPSWRVGVYIYAWCYIWCFKLLSYIFPSLMKTLKMYELGSNLSAGKIGFISGTVFWAIFILICFTNSSLNKENIIIIVILLPTFSALGWLSLLRYRDYELEKEKYGKM